MITFFTMPRRFEGLFATIQRNAIVSWTRLDPRPEIILMGDDQGVAELAHELGLKHCPVIECNEYGTPLVSDMFVRASETSGHRLLNYINADIILLSDFNNVLPFVRDNENLMISGRRWDLDVGKPINFEDPEWEHQIRSDVLERGKLHRASGVDYFIFSAGLFNNMPRFAVGRTFYDAWFFWYCRNQGVNIVDATEVVTCIHQNHDRTYSSIGKQPVKKVNSLRDSDEAVQNVRRGGGRLHGYQIMDATHKLTASGLTPVSGPAYWPYRLRRFLATNPATRPAFRRALDAYARARGLPV